ncbi:MAG: DUF3791 domain-containing protein [Lachnospiraceae bacterium]|nr:DUF3791 domain-containing protein [Lachnospiraceae bacterium]
MNANPILLQKKYARVVELFAEENYLSLDDALAFFYESKVYELMREGSSDMHCMSDQYLSKDLSEEYERERRM